MSAKTKLVGPAEFMRETGLVKSTFYNLLKQMIAVGVAAKTQKKIDMNCDWMVDYMARAGTFHRKHISTSEPPQVDGHGRVGNVPPSPPESEELPPVEVLNHLELAEKVNKLKLDNAVKERRLISRVIVERMIDKIDDALNKIIIDGESSFVPQLVQLVIAEQNSEDGLEMETIKKFWRKEISKIISPVKPFMKRLFRAGIAE